MPEYVVAIQVIEVWAVTVEADSEEAAESKVYELSASAIREDGSLESVETDFAECVDTL